MVSQAEDETARELETRLQDLAKKWSKDCNTVEALRDLMVKEQLLNALPTEVASG